MARQGRTSSRGRNTAADLSSVEGLYNVARSAGGAVSDEAQDIVENRQSIFGKIGSTIGRGLLKTLDVLQRPNYAIASATKNILDKDTETTALAGLKTGITGQTKNTFSDVFTEIGINPESTVGKVAKGTAGFALDVLLDPTTYLTFGTGAGAKVAVGGVTKRLSKEGTKLFTKGMAQKSAESLGADAIKTSISRMAESSPQLYQKFIDQGGIKFFGKQLVSGGRIAEIVNKIPGMTKLDEATKPIRNTIGSLFDRNVSAKYGRLPQEYVELTDKLRNLSKTKADEAINSVVDIARANKITADEANIITNAIEKGLPLADNRLDNARRQFSELLERNLADEQAKGIKIGELPNYVPHITLEQPIKEIPWKPGGIRTTMPFEKERTLPGTIEEIRQTFGRDVFDENIMSVSAIRGVASARAVQNADFLNEVVKKFGAVAENAPSNYVEIGIKELKGYKFHPAIAENIMSVKQEFISDVATNKLLKSYDNLVNYWKASVTSIFPAFHGRNAISNVFLNFLDLGKDVLNPAKVALSSQMLFDDHTFRKLETLSKGVGDTAKLAAKQLDTISKKPVFTDATGKVWSFGELRKVIRENRVALSDEFTGFLDVRDEIGDKLGKLVDKKDTLSKIAPINPLSQQNVAFKAGRKLGNVIEQQSRLFNFLTNLQKTGDVVTSAERTKQFLFDYSNLSNFEKNVMKRLIPFYTFTRKNLELQATQLLKQPGKYATQAKLFTNLSKGLSGGTLTDEEKKLLPEFLQEGLGIIFDRQGNKIEMISTIGSPIENVFSTLKPNAILGSLSPVIAVPLQAAIGKHFFFDKDLKDVDTATAYQFAPQFIKDYIGFAERRNKDGSIRYIALNPTRMFILNNIPPNSRVVSTIDQLSSNNVSGKLKVWRLLTGLKPYGQDLDSLALQAEKTKIKELQELLDTSGVAPIFKKNFIPSQ